MRLSVIVPTLGGEVPPSAAALGDRVELVVVKGVSPVAAARNEGLARATGEYVAWIDADDEIASDWYDEIRRALADGPDVVSFDARVEWTDGSGRKGYRLDGRRNGQLWTKVFRRSLFDGLSFSGSVHEDWRIQCQLPKDVRRVHIGKELYRYRRNATGLSQHRDLRGEIAALWGLLKICDGWPMFRGVCERAWDLAKQPARRMFARRRTVAAERGVWLVDARTLGSRPTGIGMYAARQCARMMREHPERRFVLATDVKESAEILALEANGAEVRVYGRRVFNSAGVLGYFRFLSRTVAEARPEVFWQPNNLQPFRPQGARRVIVTMHDVYGLGWSWRYAPWHLYYRLAFRRTLRNATEIWCNSKETERNVSEAARRAGCGGSGSMPEALATRVVYPIVEVPQSAGTRPRVRERPYFLYIGNVERRKGADVLIAAYGLYRKRREGRPGACPDLVFAGIEKNVRVPRRPGIAVLGYVDEATKLSLMKSCVALVVPSLAEGYGMQVAEASALGIRCIASDLSVFREIDPRGRETFPAGDVAALADALSRHSSCGGFPAGV